MDALSSQANVSGYKAALIAADRLPRFFPMLMTAAGTVAPAKVLVLGAGVAGLQAIATARRLGAVITGFDVRPVVKEQVESLGATFLELSVRGEETAGRLRGGADARAAGAAAGRARGEDGRLRRGDHDRAHPRPPGAAADPGLGRRGDAPRLGHRRPRRRGGRQLRADHTRRDHGRARRHDRRPDEPSVDDAVPREPALLAQHRRARVSCSSRTDSSSSTGATRSSAAPASPESRRCAA